MLVSFTFKNFRSFRDEKTLSMEAASVKELNGSVMRVGGYRLLPAAVMYGANSSGKSNVLKALLVMRGVLLSNVRLNPDDLLDYQPFKLDKDSVHNPTSFEIQFIAEGARYRYGFEYDREHICCEWLYEKVFGQREYNLFLRQRNDFKISETLFPEGLGKENDTPSNRLFVSLVAQLNGAKSIGILKWFRKCNGISGIASYGYEGFSLKMFRERLDGYAQALKFFQYTKLGFNDLQVSEETMTDGSEISISGMPVERKRGFPINLKGRKFVKTETNHSIYDASGKVIGSELFDMNDMESDGTKKIIELSGPVFDTLHTGKVLIVDELDASLHPVLTRSIVQLFMNPSANANGAQLIFTTHDTNLLNLDYLRRDQIWFTEKDEMESSDLYSLVEFRDATGIKVRNDRSIRQDYINGRYGAIPFLGI